MTDNIPRTDQRKTPKVGALHSHELTKYHSEVVQPLIDSVADLGTIVGNLAGVVAELEGRIEALENPEPETPPVEPPPVEPPPPTIKSVRVTTIPTLLSTLADNTVDEIVVANGTYRVAPSHTQAATSLWIGSKFAARTRPITVRAETPFGVTIDGGGGAFGGISFNGGAHHQTWDGFQFANGKPTETGVVMFGGYGLPGAHHITLRNITVLPSVKGPVATNQDHCMYFSTDGWHDILIEDYTATPGPNIQSALQFHHDPNGYNLVVRRMHVVGTQSTILLYTSSLHDVLIEDSDIRDARDAALNVYQCGANVVLRNVTSVNSGGVYYAGPKPAGLTLVNCNLQ
jgi:hypothetical protein